MVDISKLLAAIRKVETSNADEGGIRFETSWMPKDATFAVQGKFITGTGASMTAVARKRWDKYGIWTSASYGPWQMLYHLAADLGMVGHPCSLMDPVMAETRARERIQKIISLLPARD